MAQVNAKIINKVPGEHEIINFLNIVETLGNGDLNGVPYLYFSPEFLQGLDFPSLPPASLELKLGRP